MNSIKKLLTSIKRRGKPILAAFITCLTVVLLSTALPAFYNSLAVETKSTSKPLKLKAWSYRGLDKFKMRAENWYSAYGVEIDDSVDYVVKKGGGTLDLTEKCKNKPFSPCRYWFWIKANITYGVGAERTAANTLGMLSNSLTSLTAPIADAATPQYWNTAWFQGSSTKIKQPFNALDGEDNQKVERIHIKEGGIFKDTGHAVGGDTIDLYCVDIKEWYNSLPEDELDEHGVLYLQTVPKVHMTDDSEAGPFYTLASWKDRVTGYFRPSGIEEYPEHYNQWIKILPDNTVEDFRSLTVYAVKSVGDKPTQAEMECKRTNENLLTEIKEKRESQPEAMVDFHSIKTLDDNGIKYKLKGIRVQADDAGDNNFTGRQRFYILDSSVFKSASKTTDQYSKPEKSGMEKDTVTGTEFNYHSTYDVTLVKEGNHSKFVIKETKVDISDDTTKTFEEPETPTGRKNYKFLRDLLTSMKFKIGKGNTQICLVYQQVEKAKIILKTRAFDYDVKSGKHVKDDGSVKDYELGTINSEQDSGPFNLKDNLVESSSGETSVVAAMEELGKKYEINHKCANANTKHFLTKLSLGYTDLNGEEHTITDGNAPSWRAKMRKSGSSRSTQTTTARTWESSPSPGIYSGGA